MVFKNLSRNLELQRKIVVSRILMHCVGDDKPHHVAQATSETGPHSYLCVTRVASRGVAAITTRECYV